MIFKSKRTAISEGLQSVLCWQVEYLGFGGSKHMEHTECSPTVMVCHSTKAEHSYNVMGIVVYYYRSPFCILVRNITP